MRKYPTNLDNSVGWWNRIKIWQFVHRIWNLIKFNYSSGCLSCGGLAFNFLSTFSGPSNNKQTTLAHNKVSTSTVFVNTCCINAFICTHLTWPNKEPQSWARIYKSSNKLQNHFTSFSCLIFKWKFIYLKVCTRCCCSVMMKLSEWRGQSPAILISDTARDRPGPPLIRLYPVLNLSVIDNFFPSWLSY